MFLPGIKRLRLNSKSKLIDEKIKLVEDLTSPLFRIMSVHNIDEPSRRNFRNNIVAFHIGNGIVLSVAHNLRLEAGLFLSTSEAFYQTNVLQKISANLHPLFNTCYRLDPQSQTRTYHCTNSNEESLVINELRRVGCDTRWIKLSENNMCKPALIVQFKNDRFFDEPDLTSLFAPHRHFAEPNLNRHTFIIELELVDADYSSDIAVYRIINTDQNIIDRIPKIEPSFKLLDNHTSDLNCLQSAPSSELGRLLNESRIEGLLEHWSQFPDRIGGNYLMEGTRYLIRGYFRFGSSGAPYVAYNRHIQKFEAVAIQSEASPIQLSIGGNRNGNFQYVNAIASPLRNVQDRVERIVGLNRTRSVQSNS